MVEEALNLDGQLLVRWREGFWARREGKPREPGHPAGTRSGDAWLAGWDWAHENPGGYRAECWSRFQLLEKALQAGMGLGLKMLPPGADEEQLAKAHAIREGWRELLKNPKGWRPR